MWNWIYVWPIMKLYPSLRLWILGGEEILLDTTYNGGVERLVAKCKGDVIIIIIYYILSP